MNLTPQQRSSIVLDYVYKVQTEADTVWNYIQSPSLDGHLVQIPYFCKEFDSDGPLPSRFTSNGTKLQYDLRSYNLGRPVAQRVLFLDLFPNHFDDPTWTVSHLCHNERCYAPEHLWFEPLPINKGRNGCPGPHHGCGHKHKCLIPGRYAFQ